MRFEWDDEKNASNRKKHGLSFETAARAFFDPMRVTFLDQVVEDEVRWKTIGRVGDALMLLVVHTVEDDDDEVVRIISARKPIKRERRIYEEEH